LLDQECRVIAIDELLLC